ncbi:MAG: alpha/beta fold hydrolase [Chloroflexi bacterium]|nr:alpha/beta fold hydrolase [Chloroflexota bacterium]
MPIAEVNGIKLHYEEHPSQAGGYPVVFAHAFAGTTEMWKPQVPVFSRRYRFIIYDARGHGRSESPPSVDSYSADIVVEDLYQLLRSLNIAKAVVGGLSTGGYQSLRFYLRHPEMVTALVLMGTGPGYRNPEHMAEWNRKQEKRARLLETAGIAAFADEPGSRGILTYTPRELLLKQNLLGLAHMARKVIGQHDTEVIEHLAEIKVPTLVVAGADDTAFLAAASYMAKTIPGARNVVIPKAGHAMNLDNPAAFNEAVLGFLDSLKLT